MSMNIFSGFDDHNKVAFDLFYLMWVATMLMVVLAMRSYFLSMPWNRLMMNTALNLVEDLVSRTKAKEIGGSSMISALFIFLVIFNLEGLFPYVFSLTSHLAVNLSLAAPIWLSTILSGVFYNFPSFLSHLQPAGAPAVLNPFLCVIEMISLLVRPLTLAVRLTANLSTGHILMSLMGAGFMSSNNFVGVIMLTSSCFYFMFEMGVCAVQGYIFTLLPTLYLDEHPA